MNNLADSAGGPVSLPMLLTLDGEYPQIVAVFNRVIEIAKSNNIEILKFPGGSSMQYQPNDLIRSHAIIHLKSRILIIMMFPTTSATVI